MGTKFDELSNGKTVRKQHREKCGKTKFRVAKLSTMVASYAK